jgi:sialic acid synthase SpsE
MTAEAFWRQMSDPARPPLLLPDIGGFFGADLSLSSEKLLAIHSQGADYVTGELVAERSRNSSDHSVSGQRPDRVPLKEYERIFEPCDELGLGLVLKVHDLESAEFAAQLGASALKCEAGGDDYLSIAELCNTREIPLLFETAIDDYDAFLLSLRSLPASHLMMEYRPDGGSETSGDLRLRVIHRLAEDFSGPVALGGGDWGEEVLYAAAALGYRVLEARVRQDNFVTEHETDQALPISRLNQIIMGCRRVHRAVGWKEVQQPVDAAFTTGSTAQSAGGQ